MPVSPEILSFFQSSKMEFNSLEIYADRLYVTDSALIRSLVRSRDKFGHKGNFGHCLVIAGSKEMPGASILTSKAALTTGCGLLTAYIPDIAIGPMLSQLPEAMVIDSSSKSLGDIDLDKFDAIAFGPGLSINDNTLEMLTMLLNNYKGMLVIDADGLNVLAQNKELIYKLHKNVVLTPHPMEFDRLTFSHKTNEERIISLIELTEGSEFTVLLKGHHSVINRNKNLYINTTGNDGMATAGSGDVLTGVIASLCAQGYEAATAAILGCYLHGYAGDASAARYSKHTLIASGIIQGLPDFFKEFET